MSSDEWVQPDRRCPVSFPVSGRCLLDAPHDGDHVPQNGRTALAFVAERTGGER